MKKKHKLFLRLVRLVFVIAIVFTVIHLSRTNIYATDTIPTVSETETTGSSNLTIGISAGNGSDLASVLQILLVLTVIALAPSILIMLTSFTRILIVMHFTRSAIGTQTAPPNQILIGISLFLTIFIMSPVFGKIYTDAYLPFSNDEITQEEFLDAAIDPLRNFMFNQVDDKDLDSMCQIAGITSVSTREDIPTTVLIPAFIISELRIAFFIGFLIYIPFLVIDMVVSSVLMSMGMMMLPPTTISMPFKILLFVLADGWNLIIVNLVKTFTV